MRRPAEWQSRSLQATHDCSPLSPSIQHSPPLARQKRQEPRLSQFRNCDRDAYAASRPCADGEAAVPPPASSPFLPRKTQKGTKSFFDRITGLTRYLIFSVSLLRLCVRRKTSWRAWRAWLEIIFTQRPQRAPSFFDRICVFVSTGASEGF